MFKPLNAIKVSADSVETLRKCDVFRVVEWCPAENREELVAFIVRSRPDLATEATDVISELVG